jgi:hypothetical protein
VAYYNKFTTVGGYWPLYPLEYKHRFRRVIAGELEKSETLRAYFDEWGNRCYLFSAELGRDLYVTKQEGPKRIRRLDIDTRALADLGTCCVLSAVTIDNAAEIGLRYLGNATDDRAATDLHVYEIACPTEPGRATAAASAGLASRRRPAE